MNITDFRRSSAAIIIGTSTNTLAVGGVTISSNSSAQSGWVLVSTGSNSAIWRDGIAFGSNATDVSSVGTGGASSSNSRADHVHRGVRSISHTSNTSFGNVTLVAQDPVHITSIGNGTYTVGAVAVRSVTHASNTFTGAVTLTTPGNTVGITVPTAGTLAFTASGGSTPGGTYTGPTWTIGTSMPVSPATTDRITRTDLGRDYEYNGTRWLSVQTYQADLPGVVTALQALSATTALGRIPAPFVGVADIWLVEWEMSTRVSTTNDGTKYWSQALRKITAAVAVTTISTMTTISDAPDTFVGERASIGALLNNGTTHTTLDIVATKVSTPGNLDVYATLYYKLVGT